MQVVTLGKQGDLHARRQAAAIITVRACTNSAPNASPLVGPF